MSELVVKGQRCKLVKIVLIARVNIINMASGIYLKDKHLEYSVHMWCGIKSKTEGSWTYVGKSRVNYRGNNI